MARRQSLSSGDGYSSGYRKGQFLSRKGIPETKNHGRILRCNITRIFRVSRPEKGLQKRVNLMQQTTNSDLSRHYLPRQLRHLILQEYLSGVKTARQLSEEHGIPMSTIHKMGQRWKAKNSCSFVSTPNPYPIMSRVTSEEASELLSENKALRRRLEEALLRLEGYEIMGDILQEEYGIDLLKKSAAGQSSVSKKDTQQ